MLCNRPPVVTALVRQCRRGAEHFYDRNEAKEKEYDPDDRLLLSGKPIHEVFAFTASGKDL